MVFIINEKKSTWEKGTILLFIFVVHEVYLKISTIVFVNKYKK